MCLEGKSRPLERRMYRDPIIANQIQDLPIDLRRPARRRGRTAEVARHQRRTGAVLGPLGCDGAGDRAELARSDGVAQLRCWCCLDCTVAGRYLPNDFRHPVLGAWRGHALVFQGR